MTCSGCPCATHYALPPLSANGTSIARACPVMLDVRRVVADLFPFPGAQQATMHPDDDCPLSAAMWVGWSEAYNGGCEKREESKK